MNRLTAFISVYLFCAGLGLAQNPVVDSLKFVLTKSSNERRVEILHALIINLWLSHPELALQYAKESIKISDQLMDTRLQAISFRLIGGVYTYKGMYDSTLYYTKIAHSLSIKINDSTLISNTYNNLGFVYYHLGSYAQALENLLRSLNVKYKIKQDYGLSSSLNNLGLVYTKLKDYDEARKYFNEAMNVAERLKDNDRRLYSSNNMGSMYLQRGNFNEAEKYFNQSLEIAKTTNNKNWHATAYSGLAQTYFSMGLIDHARQQFNVSLTMRNEIQDNRGISEIFYYLSKIHLASGYLDSAFYNLWISQRIARQSLYNEQLLENFKLFKQLHMLKKQFDSAHYYQSHYIEMRNNQFNENSARKLADIQLAIQEEESVKQLAKKDAQLKRKTLQTYFSVAIAILIIAFSTVIYRYYRVQKRLTRDLDIKNHKITKQKKEIARKNRELLDLNTEKNNLIGIVAHDLKSPLNQIKGLISVIKMSPGSADNETAQYIQMIDSSAIRLTDMIGKILDVEAIESKQLNLSLERINFSEAVQGVVNRFVMEAQRKQIKLHPSITDNVMVNVDPGYIDGVIENLLSNAIKFSPPERNVYINITSNDSKAICAIRDEGPGLTENDKKKLFGKYQRLSASPTGNETSTGLGLSIVKKFVEAMKGQIWCESEAGKGASFFVRFNLA